MKKTYTKNPPSVKTDTRDLEEMSAMPYGRAPLGTTEWVNMGDKVVKKTCHNDCIQHCHVETMTKPHCPEQCPKPCDPCAKPVDPCAKPCDPCADGWGWGALIIGFLVIFAITWLVLWLLKPSWILKNHGKNPHGGHNGHGGHGDHGDKCEVDTGKIVIASLLIALVIVILIWIIKAVTCNSRC